MVVNRNLCIGLMFNGLISHFTDKEIVKYKDVQYIAKQLHKKHFPLKNGTGRQRAIIRTPTTPKDKLLKTLDDLRRGSTNWFAHSRITDKAWIASSNNFPEDNGITIMATIYALIHKEPRLKKYYELNEKTLNKYRKAHLYEDTKAFTSSVVAGNLLKELDREIEEYNVEVR